MFNTKWSEQRVAIRWRLSTNRKGYAFRELEAYIIGIFVQGDLCWHGVKMVNLHLWICAIVSYSSSHNHGSVQNICISKLLFLSNQDQDSTETMILQVTGYMVKTEKTKKTNKKTYKFVYFFSILGLHHFGGPYLEVTLPKTNISPPNVQKNGHLFVGCTWRLATKLRNIENLRIHPPRNETPGESLVFGSLRRCMEQFFATKSAAVDSLLSF